MKKIIIAILAIVLAPTLSYAGSKAEVLHWWTSGGEAKALQVLKDDFAAQGGCDGLLPPGGGHRFRDACFACYTARPFTSVLCSDSPGCQLSPPRTDPISSARSHHLWIPALLSADPHCPTSRRCLRPLLLSAST